LETQDADEKAIAVLPKLILPIKNALASKNDDVFGAGLNALMQLSDAVGPYLNLHLKIFLSIVSVLLYLNVLAIENRGNEYCMYFDK